MHEAGPVALCYGCLERRPLAWHWRYWLCDACDAVIFEVLQPMLRDPMSTEVVSRLARRAIETMHAGAEDSRRGEASPGAREETDP